jgi:hypothetical protein
MDSPFIGSTSTRYTFAPCLPIRRMSVTHVAVSGLVDDRGVDDVPG